MKRYVISTLLCLWGGTALGADFTVQRSLNCEAQAADKKSPKLPNARLEFRTSEQGHEYMAWVLPDVDEANQKRFSNNNSTYVKVTAPDNKVIQVLTFQGASTGSVLFGMTTDIWKIEKALYQGKATRGFVQVTEVSRTSSRGQPAVVSSWYLCLQN